MKTAVALGGLALLTFVVLAPALSPGRVFFPFHTQQLDPWRSQLSPADLARADSVSVASMADKVIQLHPYNVAVRRALEAGRFPWWQDRIALGTPLFGLAMPGVLYPGNWPFFVSDDLAWYGWHAWFHLWLSAALMYVLLVRLGLRPPAALLGAVAFGFSGWMAARAHFYVILAAAAWLPGVMIGLEAVMRRGRVWGVAVIGGSFGMSLLAGFPQVAVISVHLVCLVLCLGWLAGLRARGRALPWRRLAGILAGGLLGLLIALPQLVSSWQYSGHWARRIAHVETLRAVTLDPPHAATMLWPTAFVEVVRGPSPESIAPRTSFLQLLWLTPAAATPGRSADGEALPGAPSSGFLADNLPETVAYVGILPLLLCLSVMFVGTSALGWGAIVVAAFSAGVAYGVPGVFDVAMLLPGAGVGAPVRYLLGLTFGLAVLTAVQADRLLVRGALPVILGGLVPGLFLLGAAMFVETPSAEAGRRVFEAPLREQARILAGEFGERTVAERFGDADYAWNYDRVQRAVYRLGVLLVLAAATLLVATRTRGWGRYLPVLLLAVDLSLFFRAWVPPVSSEGMYAPHAVLDDGDGRVMRVGRMPSGAPADYLFMPNLPAVLGFADAQGYPIPTEYYEGLTSRIETAERRYGSGVTAPRDWAALASPIVDVLGVGTVVAVPAGLDEGRSVPGLRKVAADGGGYSMWRNEHRAPFAYRVRHAFVGASDVEILERLAAPTFDAAEEVVLSRGADAGEVITPIFAPEPNRAASAGRGSYDEVRVLASEPGRLLLEIDAIPEPGGFVVVTQSWMPGWFATVDGEAVEVLRANHAMMAVCVSAGGKRRIVLRYVERWTQLSFLAPVLGVCAVVMLWRRRSLVVEAPLR